LTSDERGAIVRDMPATDEAAEVHRRLLLAQSDVLLEDVEMLRLNDATQTPARLREAIRALQIRLGRRNPPVPPDTLDAAHELVFAVQQRLMAANPNSPRPTRPSGRPSGQPVMTVVREDRKWKVLTLPAPAGFADDEWWELVESTVERAWDRWCYAHQHAIRAARMHIKAQVALAVAQTAWTNYWLLLLDAERIRERINAARGRLAARTFAARRP
jgi:hypothetical protein